jgi:hypothetical protein
VTRPHPGEGGPTAYRRLATRPVLAWALVLVGTRLPVAMAPLALVFLVRERPAGYSVGAGLAAVYVLGEITGAVLLGPRLAPDRARRQLGVGLAVGAGAFAGLGLLPHAHPVVLGAFALLAGFAPAAAPGGLRTLLVSQLPDDLVAAALSTEAVLNSAVWAVSPALVGVLALGVVPWLPLVVAAACMAAAAVGLRAMPRGWPPDAPDRRGSSLVRTLVRAWPVYLSAAASMSVLALAELVLPALLEQRGIAVGWAGALLAGFAVAAATGAALYGVRSAWPGSSRAQGTVLLLATAGCTAGLAVAGTLAWIATALLLAGLLGAGVQVTRSLSLRAVLPPSAHAAAYSVLYAAGAVGYATSAVLAGVVQSLAPASVAVLAGVGLTLVLIGVAAVGERGS